MNGAKKKRRKFKPEPPNWFYWEGEPKKVFEKHIIASCKRRRDIRNDCKLAEYRTGE